MIFLKGLGVLLFAALAAMLIAGNPNAYTGTASLNASVAVYCPFSVSLNVSPGYIDYGNFTVNYTIATSEPCSLNNLNRKLDIYYPNSTLLHEYVATLKTINTTPAKYYVAVNSSIFPASGTYPITLTVSNLSYTSSATGAIVLISSVNEKVTALSVPSSVKQFSQLPVAVTIMDNGGLASPNSTLVLNISGPSGYSFNYSIPALSPGQSVNESFNIPNITGKTGTYSVSSYTVFYVNSTKRESNTATASYDVYSPPPPSPSSVSSGVPPPPPSIIPPVVKTFPNIFVVNFPSFISIASGHQLQDQMTFFNPTNSPEYVNISIPSNFSKVVQISSNTLYIYPSREVSSGIIFGTVPNMSGTYMVPITVNASIPHDKEYSQTEYVELVVTNVTPGQPYVGYQIDIANNGTTVNGILSLTGAANKTLSNVTLETMLPSSIATNKSDIQVYGLPYNISLNNGEYLIRYFVDSLPPKQRVYGYYTVSYSPNPQLVQDIQNVLSIPTFVPQQDLLRIISISLPTFYVNSTNTVTADTLYTGTKAENVTFTLIGPPSARIGNPVRVVYAVPNQFITESFPVTTNSTTGTLLMQLYINAPNFNITESLPVLVLAKATTTIPIRVPHVISNNVSAIAIAITLMVAVVVFILTVARFGRPKTNVERLRRLKMIRDEIRRRDGNG